MTPEEKEYVGRLTAAVRDLSRETRTMRAELRAVANLMVAKKQFTVKELEAEAIVALADIDKEAREALEKAHGNQKSD